MTEGIQVRHSRTCTTQSDTGAKCNCDPSYRAEVYDKRTGKKIRKTFRNRDEAKGWRADAMRGVRRGTLSIPTRQTLREAGDSLTDGMRAGTIRTRKGHPYKPSAIRSYDQALRDHVYPELGRCRLSDITRNHLQDLADRLLADGLGPSSVHRALMPVRVVYRRAVKRGEIAVNPTTGLDLPTPEGGRDRFASPAEAAQLVGAVRLDDRALWATAFYAGLRRGELQALDDSNVDLAKGVIRVVRAWDEKESVFIPTKNRERRTVPIPAVLRDYLVEHKLRTGRREGLVFGRTADLPFIASNVWRRAHTAWKRAGLEPISLHECRHTFASLMIAAGVNAKALSSYMGHSSITITLDRYGHLMPGNEEEAAALLDAYLVRADTQARLAQVEG
jgi:integrase